MVLVVNTASQCGFTPQLGGLEALHHAMGSAHPGAFTVLGFPCNQFGGQDPAHDAEIQTFCAVNYGVSFPVLAKLDVNGASAAPVWEWLKGQKPGILGLKRVKWNFEKFLVGRDGLVKARWASNTKPDSLRDAVEKELAAAAAPTAGAQPQQPQQPQAK